MLMLTDGAKSLADTLGGSLLTAAGAAVKALNDVLISVQKLQSGFGDAVLPDDVSFPAQSSAIHAMGVDITERL